jgi:hypothetical protein
MPDQTRDPLASELQVSSSPRATWLWARDEATARRVREITGSPTARRSGQELPLVTDIDIGGQAMQTCEQLAAGGFTFTWHESEHPLNRVNWLGDLPGMPPRSASPSL